MPLTRIVCKYTRSSILGTPSTIFDRFSEGKKSYVDNLYAGLGQDTGSCPTCSMKRGRDGKGGEIVVKNAEHLESSDKREISKTNKFELFARTETIVRNHILTSIHS